MKNEIIERLAELESGHVYSNFQFDYNGSDAASIMKYDCSCAKPKKKKMKAAKG